MIKCNGKDVIPRLNGKELSRVMYNGKQIYPVNNVIEIQKVNTVAGDICAFDGTNKRFFRFVDSGATDNIKNYTPIGIVFIPYSHNLYGTNEIAIASIKNISLTKPDEGDYDNLINAVYGQYRNNIQELRNCLYFPCVGMNENVGNTNGTLIGYSEDSCWIPIELYDIEADGDMRILCPHNTKCAYNFGNSPSNEHNAGPAVYLENGNRNPALYQTSSPSSIYNPFADFNGKNNTNILLQYATAQPNWKTDNEILNNKNSGYSPYACCCWRFSTEGTKQGDWYIPAAGEVAYFITKRRIINDVVYKLSNLFNIDYNCQLESSSTEGGTNGHISIDDFGYARSINKGSHVGNYAACRI